MKRYKLECPNCGHVIEVDTPNCCPICPVCGFHECGAWEVVEDGN